MTTSPSATTLLVDDLRYVFGDRLQSVVAYGPQLVAARDGAPHGPGGAGPINCLALVTSMSATDLESCAGRAGRWHRKGLATPLVLTVEEFHSSLDAFPLEYGDIMRAHVRVFGPDPFDAAVIAPGDHRRACETQIKSHLLHLREGFLETGGDPTAVAALVARSAPAFVALLRHAAWLNGSAASDRADAAREGGREAGLDPGIVHDLLALDQPSTVPTTDPARLFPHYLNAVEQLARAVDAWRG